MIEKIKYTTHNPSGKYSAKNSFPRVQERIHNSSQKFRLNWWKYAAAAASVALLVGLVYYRIQQPVEVQTYSLVAQNEREQFVLPDGSLVWLNAESKLTYTDAFGINLREVNLTGEAYFEIKKDVQRPFTVNMNGSHVQVLGTIFNIKAYPTDNEIITTLVEGSVKFVALHTDKHGVILQPGQQLSFNKDNENIVVRDVDCSPYIAWKDGRLIFRQTPVKEALAIMEHTFRITITTTNSSLDYRKITGNFGTDEKPENILSVMQETLPFRYEVKHDTIFIK
jgi:ferric-dicitrate binding protein FerR (iron transport regulator)